MMWFWTLWLTVQLKPDSPMVWPGPPDPPRIQMVGIVQQVRDLGEGWTARLVRMLTGRKSPYLFLQPYGVAVDAEGRIYVTDQGMRRVTVLDLQKHRRDYIPSRGKGYAFRWPQDVAIWEAGNEVLVVDPEQKIIFRFDRTTRTLKGTLTSADWVRPVSVAVNQKSQILYVADSKGHSIHLFDLKTGSYLGKWGKRGSDAGDFNFPTQVNVDRKGQVYVVDMGNFRVQVFNAEGELLSFFGEPGDRPPAMARPRGVAVDSEGHIYVTDALYAGFQIFDIFGRPYLFVGGPGKGFGQFVMPGDVFIDARNRIYITDPLNHRLQIFQYLPEKTDEE